LLAEFNRRSGGHIGYASADKYRHNGGRNWKNFVYSMANDWEKMNLVPILLNSSGRNLQRKL
jgi:hypothetical protein